MDLADIYIEDELKEVVDRVNTKLLQEDETFVAFKFFFGEDEHVIKAMKDMKAANAEWNPLFAVVLPIDIRKGNAGGYYGIASIPRIVIAKVTDPVKSSEYRKENIIKPFITPFYNEFLKQIPKQKTFAVMGKQIEHTMRIRYGTSTAAQGFAEYIDGAEIIDLKITLKQNCI